MLDPLTLSDLDRIDEASAHRHSVHNGSGLTLDRGTLESLLSMAREALLARDARPMLDGWRDGRAICAACVKLAAEAIEPCPECATLRAENERLTREVDRLTHCHVCGDCLDILDGRCELHANVEDETDYWHQGGERFECECSWCKANEALNAKEPDHA
jgi:hypothetical protein